MDSPVTIEQSYLFIASLIGFFSFPALFIGSALIQIGWEKLTDWVKAKAHKREAVHFDRMLQDGETND